MKLSSTTARCHQEFRLPVGGSVAHFWRYLYNGNLKHQNEGSFNKKSTFEKKNSYTIFSDQIE